MAKEFSEATTNGCVDCGTMAGEACTCDSSRCCPVVGAGMPIDLNDKHGNPVHIGDTIDFDEKEWGATFVPYVVTVESGEIQLWGSPSDFPVHCEIVKRWDQAG